MAIPPGWANHNPTSNFFPGKPLVGRQRKSTLLSFWSSFKFYANFWNLEVDLTNMKFRQNETTIRTYFCSLSSKKWFFLHENASFSSYVEKTCFGALNRLISMRRSPNKVIFISKSDSAYKNTPILKFWRKSKGT